MTDERDSDSDHNDRREFRRLIVSLCLATGAGVAVTLLLIGSSAGQLKPLLLGTAVFAGLVTAVLLQFKRRAERHAAERRGATARVVRN